MIRRQDPGYIDALITKKIEEKVDEKIDPIVIWGQQTYSDNLSTGIPIRVNSDDSYKIINYAKNMVIVYYIDNAQQAFPSSVTFPIRVMGTSNKQPLINREPHADGYRYNYENNYMPVQASYEITGMSDDLSEIYKRKVYLHNFDNVVQFTAFDAYSYPVGSSTSAIDTDVNTLKIIQVYFTF